MKTIFAAAAVLVLAGCGGAQETVESIARSEVAVDGEAAARAVVSSVDVEAAKGLATGAAKDALREALPTEEIGVAAAIIDEKALVNGLGDAVGATVKGKEAAAAAPAPE